ncbi:MAG: hypothetical protein F6K53_06960 [Moorea sp. SIO4A1]|uniref:hypothetical protein n=2 Tax=unclassified Moorena TaxID=2683338 RepID=UPI00144F2E38|nr:hypothetical protein [Moorena sp. SIO4A1]NEQ57166.1 hypothetical protein [Moorena sp. SIO4A1]
MFLITIIYTVLAFYTSRFPIPDSRFPIPDFRFPIPDSRFPIPDSRFPIVFYRINLWIENSKIGINSVDIIQETCMGFGLDTRGQETS